MKSGTAGKQEVPTLEENTLYQNLCILGIAHSRHRPANARRWRGPQPDQLPSDKQQDSGVCALSTSLHHRGQAPHHEGMPLVLRGCARHLATPQHHCLKAWPFASSQEFKGIWPVADKLMATPFYQVGYIVPRASCKTRMAPWWCPAARMSSSHCARGYLRSMTTAENRRLVKRA